MAFNPFDVFRRNQRILFSVLTVFTMFMFVLSFGQNDFFSWFPKWLGTKRGTGEVMAVVDGSKVHSSQLHEIGLRRELANTYMFNAGQGATAGIAKHIMDSMARVGEDAKNLIQEFMFARRGQYIDPQLMQRYEMAQRFAGMGFSPPSFEEMVASRGPTIARMQAMLSAYAGNPKAKPDEKDVAQSALYLMALDMQLQAAGNGRFYFANQPNATLRDRLDFYLWLKKADDLGITFTTDDVNALIQDEFHGKATAAELQQALGSVSNKLNYTEASLQRALADEFRVRTAQSAVLGASYARAPGPLAVGYDAPYDYFEYYKSLTSPARFGVVTIPADLFLSSVADKPSESDLRKLFDKARSIEPSPEKAAIGLRKPRELKLAWLEAKGDEPFYKAAAADAQPKLEAHTFLLAALTPATGGPAAGLAAVAIGKLQDPLLQRGYLFEKQRTEQEIEQEWFLKAASPWSNVRAVDASRNRPQVAAVWVGAMASSFATGGPWWDAVIAADQAVAVYDWQGRGVAMAALLSPPFSLADRLGAVADHLARVPQPLPMAAFRPRLIEAAKESLTKQIAVADLVKFSEELTKLGAKSDKTEARTAAEKFIKERGLKSGASAAFHDQYTIGEDPGLAPLKVRLAGPHGTADVQFGRQFFFDNVPTRAGGTTEQEARTLFQPQPYPDPRLNPMSQELPALVWRTEEKAAENPRDLNPEVRARTEAGWKKLEARKKAKEAADAFAKECGSLGTDEPTIYKNLQDKINQFLTKFPDGKARVKYFEMRDVAPLVTPVSPLPGRSFVTPFVLTKTGEIPFPTEKMTEELLAARQKPPSTSIVLVDQPQDNYYVAVLLGETEKTPSEFAAAAYGPAMFNEVRNAVERRHQDELKKKAYEAAVGLLKAEYRVKDESADLDKRSESSDE